MGPLIPRHWDQRYHTEYRYNMLGSSLLISALFTLSHAANLVEVLTKHGATKLVDLAVKAGLADTLTGDGPLTVFAPTNEAIEALPADLVSSLMKDTDMLKQVLLFHVVAGQPLLVNLYLKSKYYDGFITINGKRVVKADQKASNGLIHYIDGVMLPPKGDLLATVLGDERFSTMVAAVKAADLVDVIGGAKAMTIFAPTNDAFAKIPADALSALLEDKEALTKVLMRHGVGGSVTFSKGIMWAETETAGGETIATQVFRRGVIKVVSVTEDGTRTAARVVDADIAASNGVIHAIDTVL